jgi:hypothetical protein
MLHRDGRLKQVTRHFFSNLINYFNFDLCQSKRLFLYFPLNDTNYRLPLGWFCLFMVLNATFNNISVILVEETGVPGENHRPAASH